MLFSLIASIYRVVQFQFVCVCVCDDERKRKNEYYSSSIESKLFGIDEVFGCAPYVLELLPETNRPYLSMHSFTIETAAAAAKQHHRHLTTTINH